MAVNDDIPQRDPQLARLLAAAGDAMPPAALDDSILAAARREVGARPQAAAGAGESVAPLARARRNWYVPVSIAAVLVLSVSLVTLVHEEKGAELTQPPAVANAPPEAAAKAPTAPTAPAAPSAEATVTPAPAPATAAREPDIKAPDEARLLRDTPDQPKPVVPAPKVAGELAKQRADTAPPSPAAPDSPRKTETPDAPMRQQSASEAIAAAPAPGGAAGESRSAAAPPPAARMKSAEPFPAAAEREAVPAGRDSEDTRRRSEAGAGVSRSAESVQAQAAPPSAESPAYAPAKPMVQPAPAAAARPALRTQDKRAPVWLGLESQPPEKWLERLAQLKREGRAAEAEELLNEFRRRFPDHPAGAR